MQESGVHPERERSEKCWLFQHTLGALNCVHNCLIITCNSDLLESTANAYHTLSSDIKQKPACTTAHNMNSLVRKVYNRQM